MQDLTFALTEEDKHNITNYISAYSSFVYSNNSVPVRVPIPELLSYWSEAKSKYLYSLMGHNLILKKTIEYHQRPNEVKQALNSLYDTVFFKNLGNYSFYYKGVYTSLLSIGALYDNRVTVPITVEIPGNRILTFPIGAKVLHCLHKLAVAYNIEGFEEFRRLHSKILNQKMLKGELCLSIHPLDYFTMSDNSSSWETCMSWIERKQYRAGTVEMLNSPCVLVAYLNSSAESYFEDADIMWNNKKWRTLIIADETSITSIKGYPYENDDFAKICVSWVKELAQTNLGWQFQEKMYHNDHRFYFTNDDGQWVKIRYKTNQMYNDTDCTKQRWGFFTSAPHENFPAYDCIKNLFTINYSGQHQCVSCGEPIFDGEDTVLLCNNCEPLVRCNLCECLLLEEDAHEEPAYSGYYYCESCYEDELVTCNCCGHKHFPTYNDDMSYYDISYNNHYLTTIQLCPECAEESSVLFHESEKYDRIDWTELTPEGKDVVCRRTGLTPARIEAHFGKGEIA